jgi:hypothetical protein
MVDRSSKWILIIPAERLQMNLKVRVHHHSEGVAASEWLGHPLFPACFDVR